MEQWKDIEGYESNYEVSSCGRVRAKYREFYGKNGVLKKYSEKILKPDTMVRSLTSYERVSLSKDHKVKRFFVHQLVAKAFIPNNENKPFINHIDNNGLNNNVENLEWCTHSENMIHAQKQGRLFKSQANAGKKGGAIMLHKALTRASTYVNTTKDKWLVKGISSKRRDNKICLDLECTGCNRLFQYTLTYFEHAIGTACPKCRKRKIKI